MKINAINTNTFTGYKNLIAMQRKENNNAYAMISMQLDNIGQNDLEQWVKIQKSIWPDKQPMDTLTYLDIESDKNDFYLIINDKYLTTRKDKPLFNQNNERTVLSLYRLLTNISERMMNNDKWQMDEGLTRKVVPHTIKILQDSKLQPQHVLSIINAGIFEKNTHPLVGKTIYDGIQDSLDGYFC